MCIRDRINSFLDDGNVPVLAAKIKQRAGDKTVQLSNKVEPSDTKDKVIVFFKSQPVVITPDNLHNVVLVSSMLDSPISSLYHTVKKVFAPLLLEDEKWSQGFDPKLQSLLSQLEAGLSSVIRKQDPSQRSSGREDSLGGILTPSDEFQYWAEVAMSGNTLDTKERAQLFQTLFEPIARDYGNLDGFSLDEGLQLVETTNDAVDEVWRQGEFDPYPERRMQHLLDVIGGELGRFVQRKLCGHDIWRDPFYRVREALQRAISICDKWILLCEKLTGQIWRTDPMNPWKGEKLSLIHI
ncbi:cytoplasmic dynein 2 heavy chain 1-like [Anneissia japonica]|uniref:cytoplasmic dynein 2 heavy chain 1-like n=1 Tax=Anneissia japonica TaxID=1529436 RepID=UPI0014254EDF|nr:cytoplasmic dynein 2 heavy chain 1-like [Anneissia japonica]